MREKNDLDGRVELLNKELTTKTTKKKGEGQGEIEDDNDYAYYLK